VKPGLLDWRYYFWLIPLDIAVVLFLIAPPPLSINEAIRWSLLALIAHAIMAIPFALLQRQTWIIGNFNLEVGAIAMVGLVRGFAILDIGLLMDLPQLEPYLLRPLNSAVAVPTWFVIIHFLVGSRRDFAEDYRALYVKIVREKLDRLESTRTELSVQEIESRIEEVLAPLRAKIENLQGSKIAPERLAEEALVIQSHVEEKIRPLSHELWQKKTVKAPTLGQLRLLFITVFRTRLPIGATIIPSAIYSLVGLASIMKFEDALFHQVTNSCVLFAIFLVYRFAVTRTDNLALTNLLTFIFSLSLPRLSSGVIVSLFAVTPVPGLGHLVGQLWFFFLLISFGAALAVSKYHEEIMLVLREQLEEVMVIGSTKESDDIARRFARYLHGEVQSELLSASMLLNRAAKEKNSRIGRRGIEKTAEILRRSHADYVVGRELTFEAKIQKIVDAWDGIAEIVVKVNGAEAGENEDLTPLCDVIEELVSNSVRHGGSRNIGIEVTLKARGSSVIYTDDGAARKSGKSGMGSSLIAAKTKDFKTKRTQQGNVVSFSLIG